MGTTTGVNNMKRLFGVLILPSMVSTPSMAIKRKSVEGSDSDALKADTQVTLQGMGRSYLADMVREY